MAALGELIRGLGVNARVLMIGAHPDDEDTQLITWLARGRRVETAYLSLTRGDGGQNLIGNELGEALGVIRTEELLSARRIDGGRQYFTRAYDFGFSKSAEETYKHWPKDSILRDVVTIVRDFRPHVIMAVFSGTPRDGHGHHQVSGLLAREAFELAGDVERMPPALTQNRAPWTPLKFYRRFRGTDEGTSLAIDVGEYSPLRGRSYAELAAESRSQHKSQAFGSLQRKGVVRDVIRLERSRVGSITSEERSIFDGIDTSWTRLAKMASGAARAAIDSIPAAIARVQRAFDVFAPERMLPSLARVRALARRALKGVGCWDNMPSAPRSCAGGHDRTALADLDRSLLILDQRVERALFESSGLGVETTVDHETWTASEPIVVTATLYNRGARPMTASVGYQGPDATPPKRREIPALSSATVTDTIWYPDITSPRWLASPRRRDVFAAPIDAGPADEMRGLAADIVAAIDGIAFEVRAPVVHRYADPIKGETQRPIAIVPALSVTVAEPVQYVPANRAFERVIRVELRSASNHSRTARVSLQLPSGLTADSTTRAIGLPDHSGSFGAEGESAGAAGDRLTVRGTAVRSIEFRVRGTLAEGRHTIAAIAESEGQRYTSGYTLVEYDHIRPQRLFREATIALSAVTLQVAQRLTVAYVPGVGDNVAPMLQQLGVALTIIEPDKLRSADLSRYTTLVVGPRAYESSPALVAANPRLLDFARRGGTVVVQYGQLEMTSPGIMPYPVTIARPADRVTEEDAPVRVIDGASPLLAGPNRIDAADWQGWVQERSLYMPRTHDARYRALISMNDTGEQANDNAILVAPVGAGTYVYTTLALFRQLPAGVPGAARLFVNLLSADQRSAGTSQPPPKP